MLILKKFMPKQTCETNIEGRRGKQHIYSWNPPVYLVFSESVSASKDWYCCIHGSCLLFFVVVVFASFIPSSKGPITVLEAILTSQQPHEKLLRLYDNLMSNNFRKTAVLKKKSEL